MEALNLKHMAMACMSGAGTDTRYSCWNGNIVSFMNKDHLDQDGLAKKKKEKVGIKKKLKLLKGLSKDLSAFSGMGFVVDQDNDLHAQVRGKLITEVAEVLMKQLEQLKAEEKEMKRKRKQEKAKLKEQKSSAASESNDNECDEKIKIQINRLMSETKPVLLREENRENGLSEARSLQNDGTSLTKDDEGATKRVEVCMGNKCKKSGSGALLEEFQRVMSGEGDVVGCKCMGKCRDGPNVRLFNYAVAHHPPAAEGNPLCIGVALEDVGAIVGNLFAMDVDNKAKDMGLTLNPASP